MDAQAMIDEITDHGFQGVSSSRLLSFINQTYQTVMSTPYPVLLQSNTFVQAAGVQVVTGITPTGGTLRTLKAMVNIDAGIPMRPMLPETLEKAYATALTEVGIPSFYYFVGSTLNVYQVPQADTNMGALYNIRPVDLDLVTNTTPIISGVEFCTLLINGALAKAFAMEEDVDLAPYFLAQYNAQLAVMQESLWMQQYDRPRFVENVMDDDYSDKSVWW